jgi:hypothetical protein
LALTITSKQLATLEWLLGISLTFSTILLLSDQTQLVVAWWLLLGCMIVPLLWVQRSNFLSVKVLIWVAFLTQSITMPVFYLLPKTYHFQSHRFFGYTGVEVLQVYGRLSLFLITFLLVARFLEKFIRHPASKNSAPEERSKTVRKPKKQKVGSSRSVISTVLILVIIVLMIPLNSWMFKMGIGITGVQPPKLPYSLSGILMYLARWLVPGLLALLYIRTRQRSVLLVFILGCYGMYLGLSTASRAAALSLVFAPIILAYLNGRWLIMAVASTMGLISIGLTTASRQIVYAASHGVTEANTALGVLGTMFDAARLLEWSSIFLVLPKLFARMSSFEGLFLSSQVDPSSLGGGFAVWMKTLHWKTVDLGHAEVHQEFLGYTPPEGFYNATADLYAYALWGGNDIFALYFLFAVSAALVLMLQEQALGKISNKYPPIRFIATGLTFLLSIFYTVAVGYPQFVTLFVVILIASHIPKVRFKLS